MRVFKSTFVSVFVFAQFCIAAEDPKLTFFGHNLSSTTELMSAGQCTLGFVFAACGVSNKVTLGSSPWMYLDYKMYSLAVRGLISEDSDGDRWAWQVDYFKTFNKEYDSTYATPYMMESVWNELLYSQKFENGYTMTTNLHLNYYFEQKMPFSLRRPFYKAKPLQINLTTFHQVDLVKNWFIQGEIGLIDILNSPLHFHGGSTIGKRFKNWYFYFGFSFTPAVTAMFNTGRTDVQFLYKKNGLTYDDLYSPEEVKLDYSIHPEISLQYFF